MQQKQTLKIPSTEIYNEDIISILPSSSSYVDNEYFRKYAYENLSKASVYKNNPVNVRGISIDWIINHQEENNNGREFLEALVNAQNLEVFDNDTIIAIIEYLYKLYRKKIL